MPCGFSLLPNKRSETYEMMLNSIKDKVGPTNSLRKIRVDFEIAIWTSIRILYPDVDVGGCIFHQRKAVWHHLAQLGLQPLFHNDAEFQEWVYKFYALSYCPPAEVVRLYEEQLLPLIEKKTDQGRDWEDGEEDFVKLLTYLESTWIGRC